MQKVTASNSLSSTGGCDVSRHRDIPNPADALLACWRGSAQRQMSPDDRRVVLATITPAGRALADEATTARAKIAANARWAHPMARADQADAARSAIYARLERQVDPAGQLPPDERDRLVRAAAHALSARLNNAKTRKRRHPVSG